MDLSGSAREVLWCLFLKGPTWDGDIPSKTGRGELFKQGYVNRYNGYTTLTHKGLVLALDLKMDIDKERHERRSDQPTPPTLPVDAGEVANDLA